MNLRNVPIRLSLASALLLTACANPRASADTQPPPAATEESTAAANNGEQAQADPATQPTAEPAPEAATEPATQPAADAEYAAWASVLQYVTDDGGFRYQALIDDAEARAALETFVATIAEPTTTPRERDEQLTFLINAYNAYTVRSVVQLWPVTGVLEEDGFFDARTHNVSGTQMTLNTLENESIRAQFNEPRIHFLVNCASTGCPWLIDEPVTAANLEALLERQATSYVTRTSQIDRSANTIAVSQIFEWFADDFAASGGVRAFLANHVAEADRAFVAAETTAITYFDYDWSLNSRD